MASTKKDDPGVIKPGDDRFTALRAAMDAVLGDVFAAREGLSEAEAAAKAAADAKREASEEFGSKRIAAMIALGDQVKLVSNGQGLKKATIAALVDARVPKPAKDAPNAGTLNKDRSLVKLVVEGAIAARHSHAIAAALKAKPEHEKAKLWDLFTATLRIARDVHKAGKPFEAITPDFADAAIAAKRAEAAAKREAEKDAKGEGAADLKVDDPVALLRAAAMAATAKGLDVSSINAAIAAIAALIPLDAPKPEGEDASEDADDAGELTDDLSGGYLKGLVQ